MTRMNLVLLILLVVLAGFYFLGEPSTYVEDLSGGGEPRLFREFNKEGADLIVFKGGWAGTRYIFAREGNDW
ncbi:MAG: hypothetical protein ACE10D_09435, partial [Planctomycetota bacterium]